MKRLLILATMFLQTGGQPTNIPIQNASFEQPTRVSGPTQDCGFGGYEVPGWTGNVFAFRLATGNPCGISPIPDGQYAAYIVNSTMSQDLGIKPSDGMYVLHFWIANYNYWYATPYHAALAVGDKPPAPGFVPTLKETCSTSGWAQGDFTEITLTCLSQRVAAVHLSATGNLNIVFSSEGPNGNFWPVLIDKISLLFTPTN